MPQRAPPRRPPSCRNRGLGARPRGKDMVHFGKDIPKVTVGVVCCCCVVVVLLLVVVVVVVVVAVCQGGGGGGVVVCETQAIGSKTELCTPRRRD